MAAVGTAGGVAELAALLVGGRPQANTAHTHVDVKSVTAPYGAGCHLFVRTEWGRPRLTGAVESRFSVWAEGGTQSGTFYLHKGQVGLTAEAAAAVGAGLLRSCENTALAAWGPISRRRAAKAAIEYVNQWG